ncbi:hypothetical protein V498_04855 [Pseudogymnoascus sp. VKM F-4517 (FW-2822)]|nr:hypothetical protein V498_04855 [Pseudogymnoascus sp. VKM F-4517 (FW-2822)]
MDNNTTAQWITGRLSVDGTGRVGWGRGATTRNFAFAAWRYGRWRSLSVRAIIIASNTIPVCCSAESPSLSSGPHSLSLHKRIMMSTSNLIPGQQQQGRQQQDLEQRRRNLLELRAQMAVAEAQIAELEAYAPLPAAPSQPTVSIDRPPIHRRQRSHNGISRSISMVGNTSRAAFPGRNHAGSLGMSRSVSQHSGGPVAMSRTKSMGAPPSSMSRSISSSGRIAPGQQLNGGHQSSADIDDWQSHQDGPYNTYHQQYHQVQPELAQVPELDVGEHPSSFFSRQRPPFLSVTTTDFPPSNFMINHPATQARLSPSRHSSFSNPGRNFMINHPATQARLSPSRHSSFSNPGTNTPSSTTLTTDNTFVSDMSRQSSTCNDALQSFRMMNVNSNTSIYSDFSSPDDAFYGSSTQYYPQSDLKQVSSSEEQSLLLTGAGGAGYGQQVPPYPSFAPQKMSPNSTRHVERMQRTESTDSNVSSSSASRSRQQLQRQNQLATNRKLAPKGSSDDDESQTASHLLRIKSKDGQEDRLVAPISKTPYQRPKHERLLCDLCDDREGFRGAHELGRHKDRQHKPLVQKWVCIEPVDGIKDEFRPVNPLANCKACKQQNKKYGAYYNAAAHLRRAHFVPKARGRNKSGKSDDKSEKRGGKGGGDWPPMKELKRWMKDVHESAVAVQQDDDEESGEDDVLADLDESMNMAAAPSNQMAFDQSFLFPADANMYDYPSSSGSGFVSPNDSMDMSDMGVLNTPSFGQSFSHSDFDPSMLMPQGSQQSSDFDPSMVMTTDDLSFIDPLAHPSSFGTTTNTLLSHQTFIDPDLASDFLSYDTTM